LDAEDMPALGSRRPPGATVNDVLLAALHLAIAEWNAEHGAPCERIGIMMPVNLRPPERRNALVGNFSSFVSVATDRADGRRAGARRGHDRPLAPPLVPLPASPVRPRCRGAVRHPLRRSARSARRLTNTRGRARAA